MRFLFTLFCPRSSAAAARSSQFASTVDHAHLEKSLLATPIPFYIIYYVKETRHCLYHDESQNVLSVGVGLDTAKATAPSSRNYIILVYYWTAQYVVKYVARR